MLRQPGEELINGSHMTLIGDLFDQIRIAFALCDNFEFIAPSFLSRQLLIQTIRLKPPSAVMNLGLVR